MSHGTISPLCIRPAEHHAEHYLGYTDDGDSAQPRYQRHRSGNGSPLIRAAVAAGHTVDLVWTKPGTRAEERRSNTSAVTVTGCAQFTAPRTWSAGAHVTHRRERSSP